MHVNPLSSLSEYAQGDCLDSYGLVEEILSSGADAVDGKLTSEGRRSGHLDHSFVALLQKNKQLTDESALFPLHNLDFIAFLTLSI